MKNLRLIPDIPKQQPLVKAAFACDREVGVLNSFQKKDFTKQKVQRYMPHGDVFLNETNR